ncbi:hypothetical protein NC651_002384 [Populus alba x Populus x berolinensis]|nr:hypothetical protein NC651_002384 [Populus alba x Populus x berolinensis]
MYKKAQTKPWKQIISESSEHFQIAMDLLRRAYNKEPLPDSASAFKHVLEIPQRRGCFSTKCMVRVIYRLKLLQLASCSWYRRI